MPTAEVCAVAATIVDDVLSRGRTLDNAARHRLRTTRPEDWPEVRLSFSTERPSLGTEPPRLHTDTLELRAKEQQVQVATRDQVITTTGEGAAKIVDEMPGVDDGGETLALEGEGPRSIVSDGRPHHVPLFAFESAAERELVCRPEKVEAVLLRTTAAHQGKHPLLAGPVELRRQHTGILFRRDLEVEFALDHEHGATDLGQRSEGVMPSVLAEPAAKSVAGSSAPCKVRPMPMGHFPYR